MCTVGASLYLCAKGICSDPPKFGLSVYDTFVHLKGVFVTFYNRSVDAEGTRTKTNLKWIGGSLPEAKRRRSPHERLYVAAPHWSFKK
jgi:hypothetical protein